MSLAERGEGPGSRSAGSATVPAVVGAGVVRLASAQAK